MPIWWRPAVTGRIVPAADPEAMAVEIVRLATQPDTAQHMGRAGRDLVEQKFSMNAMVAAYQGTYDKLLHRTGSKRHAGTDRETLCAASPASLTPEASATSIARCCTA